MKNTVKILGIIALVAVIVFSMAACNRGGSSAAAPAAAAAAAPAATGTTGSPAAGLTGWDAYLAEAEVYVTELASLLTRSQSGDVNASNRAIELYNLIEGLESKYAGLDADNMTEAQATRLVSLMNRLSGN